MRYSDLPRPFFVLAPMDDVTDMVFRSVISDCAPPDIAFTEFVNVDGLQSPGRPRLLKKMRFRQDETNLIVQLWGLNPENFYKTARQIADGTFARTFGLSEEYNYIGVDLNMGCPAKSEVKSGACSALILNKPLAKDIIAATRDGLDGRLPLSVKTRVGFNEVDMTWPQFLLEQRLNMLTIHGRTRREMSKVPANWDLIGQVRQMRDDMKLNTLIVGNGDVRDRSHGEALAEQYGLDGIMIGRGVFHDPFVFAAETPWQSYSAEQRCALFRRHVELFAETWQNHERPIHTLNKFCKIYIQGFDGAKELREKLMASTTIENLLTNIPR